MDLVPREQFLRSAGRFGVGLDERYDEPRCLTLLPPRKHNRFWVFPSDPASWPNFVASALDGLDDWKTGFLWPRSGRWPEPAQSTSPNESVRDTILRGAGIRGGSAGAVRVGRDEEPALIAVLYGYMSFGWCVDDDLFFVPDHGRQVVHTDHHDVMHVQCVSEDRVLKLVAHMGKSGYELPSDPPDWTFKRPAWMERP